MKFSDKLTEFNGELPATIQEAIASVREYFSIAVLKILEYDKDSIVVPVTLKLSIPPLGTIGGIDIRAEEPILIKFWINKFPSVAPNILSDRIDFPRDRLSHLYAVKKNSPANLCLVRGNVNEWFAGKRIEDLLIVAEQWFFKAAIDKLNDDGNEFDPLRLDHFVGHHVYQYEMIRDIIVAGVPFFAGQSIAALFTLRYNNNEKSNNVLTYKTLGSVQFIQIEKTLQLIKNLENKLGLSIRASPMLSLVAWQLEGKEEAEYETTLPENYGELKAFFSRRGIDIDVTLKAFIKNKYIVKKLVPVIYAIKRPKKIISFNGQFEFINFVVSLDISKIGSINENSEVIYQSHIEPFSNKIASKLSGDDRNSKTLFVGAGSLGSKIIIHDARSGKLNIGVCDDGEILQHNLVRHALFDNKVGLNKAIAIVKELEDMFETDTLRSFKSYPGKVIQLKQDHLILYNWLVDTTASLNVQNWLVQSSLPKGMNVARCELVDEGKLGLLYIEGKNRNPRIDDLVNLTYFKALNDHGIESWRRADANKTISTLDIGLGCSSTTTVMADDTISLHSATFSRLLYELKDRNLIKDSGLLFRSMINFEGIPILNSTYDLVDPFEVYNCAGGSGWEVRMIAGMKNKLLSLCKQYKPKETGGVLIGVCNYKTKTIHVFDLIEEPRDSIGTCTGFTRGIIGLPKAVDVYKEKTGDVIGYIGEWHTHPMDLEKLSIRDHETIEDLKAINNKIPIPTCAVIVTNSKVIPFVY